MTWMRLSPASGLIHETLSASTAPPCVIAGQASTIRKVATAASNTKISDAANVDNPVKAEFAKEPLCAVSGTSCVSRLSVIVTLCLRRDQRKGRWWTHPCGPAHHRPIGLLDPARGGDAFEDRHDLGGEFRRHRSRTSGLGGQRLTRVGRRVLEEAGHLASLFSVVILLADDDVRREHDGVGPRCGSRA